MDKKIKISEYAVIMDLVDRPCADCANGTSFPVHRAAISGHVQCMKHIFASLTNADILLDCSNSTPFHAAASAGQLECLKFLSEYTRIPVQHQNFQGETCVHVSVLHHQLDSLKILLSGSFKKAQSLAFLKDNLGCTVLHCAVLVNDNDIALWLLQRFGKNIANIANEDGVLPLHVAAAQGNIEFIRIATKYDALMVNKRDKNGATAAFYAVQAGYLLCLKYLVEKAKADVRILTKRGQSLVHAACLNGQTDIVDWLFSILDKSFVCQQTRDAATPFHCAAYGGHEATLRLLHKLSGGKRLLVLLTDRRGNTPLHLAALKGHVDCADLLLKLGADPEVRNKTGQTPIDIAEKRKYTDLSRLLQASAEGSQIVNGNIMSAEKILLRNSLRVVRPNSMSTSGYSSTAGPSEPYELAMAMSGRRRIEDSSGYASSSSIFLKRKKTSQKNSGITWKAKTVSVRDRNEGRAVLAYDNWLLRRKDTPEQISAIGERKPKVGVQKCHSETSLNKGQHKLTDTQIQTDFDPLVDNIIIVDDDERIIFSSVTSIPTVFNSVWDKSTPPSTNTNSLESCFVADKQKQQQRRINEFISHQQSVSDQSLSESDMRESGSDFKPDVRSLSTSNSSDPSYSTKSDAKEYEMEQEADVHASQRMDAILRRELEDNIASDDYDSGIISNATNTVLTVVQQCVQKVTSVRNGNESSSTLHKAGRYVVSKSLLPRSGTLSQASFGTLSSMEQDNGSVLRLPFLHEDDDDQHPVSTDDICEHIETVQPTIVNVETSKLERSSPVQSIGSIKSVSLTDFSRIASRVSDSGVKSNFDNGSLQSNSNANDVDDEACPTEKSTSPSMIIADGIWQTSAEQQQKQEENNVQSGSTVETRRCFKKEQKTVMFKRSSSPPSRVLPSDYHEYNRSRVAEIKKRLEQHFSAGVQRYPQAINNLHYQANGNREGDNIFRNQQHHQLTTTKCERDKINELDQSSSKANLRYFGTSNGSDTDLRKNMHFIVTNHIPCSIRSNAAKRVLKETDIDKDIIIPAACNNREQPRFFYSKGEPFVQVL